MDTSGLEFTPRNWTNFVYSRDVGTRRYSSVAGGVSRDVSAEPTTPESLIAALEALANSLDQNSPAINSNESPDNANSPALKLFRAYQTLFRKSPQSFSRASFDRLFSLIPPTLSPMDRPEAALGLAEDMRKCVMLLNGGQLEQLLDLGAEARDPRVLLFCYQSAPSTSNASNPPIPASIKSLLTSLNITPSHLGSRNPLAFSTLYLAATSNLTFFPLALSKIDPLVIEYTDLHMIYDLSRGLPNVALARFFDRKGFPAPPWQIRLALRAAAELGASHAARDVFGRLEEPTDDDLGLLLLAQSKSGDATAAASTFDKLAQPTAANRANLFSVLLTQLDPAHAFGWFERGFDDDDLLPALAVLAAHAKRIPPHLDLRKVAPNLFQSIRKVEVPHTSYAELAVSLVQQTGPADEQTYRRIRDSLRSPDSLRTWLELHSPRPPEFPIPSNPVQDGKGWNRLLRLSLARDATDPELDPATLARFRGGMNIEAATLGMLLARDPEGYPALSSLPVPASAYRTLFHRAVEKAREDGEWTPVADWYLEIGRQGFRFSVGELTLLVEGVATVLEGPTRSVPDPSPTRQMTATETLLNSMLSLFDPGVPDSLAGLLAGLSELVVSAHGKETEEFQAAMARVIKYVVDGPKTGDIFQVRTEGWKRDLVVRTLVPALLDASAVLVAPTSNRERRKLCGKFMQTLDALESDPAVVMWDVAWFYQSARDRGIWSVHAAGKRVNESAVSRIREVKARLLVLSRDYAGLLELLETCEPGERKRAWWFLTRCRDQTVAFARGCVEKHQHTLNHYPLAARFAADEFEMARAWKAVGDLIGWERAGAVDGLMGRIAVDRERGGEWNLVPMVNAKERGKGPRWRGSFAGRPE